MRQSVVTVLLYNKYKLILYYCESAVSLYIRYFYDECSQLYYCSYYCNQFLLMSIFVGPIYKKFNEWEMDSIKMNTDKIQV